MYAGSDEFLHALFAELTRLRRRYFSAMVFTGLVTLYAALPVVFFSSTGLTAPVLLAVFASASLLSTYRWWQLKSALQGLEFSAPPLHMPVAVEPLPLASLEEYHPLPRWLVPQGNDAASEGLVQALDEILARHPELAERRRECLACHGRLTNHDAANLLTAAQGLERARNRLES